MKITNALPPIPTPTPSGAPANPKKNLEAQTEKSSPGSVLISESLARMQLNQRGITDPTAEQLETALCGGNLSGDAGENSPSAEVPGILILRNQKTGWGRTAKRTRLQARSSGERTAGARADSRDPRADRGNDRSR